MKKIIFRWVKLVILVYSVIGIIFYNIQDWLLLHPTKIEAGKAYAFKQPSSELNLNYDTATNLNVVEFKATDRPADSLAKGVVLFFSRRTGKYRRLCRVEQGDDGSRR